MKKFIIFILCLCAIQSTYAQTASTDVLSPNNQTLKERFSLMKSKSQNYQDYKVIKETTLDGVWKIIEDSLGTKQAAFHAVQAEVKKFKEDINQANIKLKDKEQSMSDITFESTHINALGVKFQKNGFITLVLIITGVLIAGLVLIAGRLKLMQSAMKEKTDLFDIISKEYDEYKRKALDKQTKLSRELQDERNKMHR